MQLNDFLFDSIAESNDALNKSSFSIDFGIDISQRHVEAKIESDDVNFTLILCIPKFGQDGAL